MRILCCQFDIAWENKDANFDKVKELLANTRPPAGSLVVLPEMSFTGFSMDVTTISDCEPDRTEAFLAELARRFGIYILAGLVTSTSAGRGRNEALFVTPRGTVDGRYQKVHLFSPANEDSFFESGDCVTTFRWGDLSVSPFICYDLRFPEVFREAVDQGAELFVVIANWPRIREGHWLTLLQARAIENQAFVAGVNRCGNDPTLDYSGRSVVISPSGEVLADAGNDECIIRVDLDFSTLREYRSRFPVLKDRRSARILASRPS